MFQKDTKPKEHWQSHIIVGRNSDIVCSFNSKRRANILHKKVYEMFDQNEIKNWTFNWSKKEKVAKCMQ